MCVCNGMESVCSLSDGRIAKLNYFSFHVHLNLLEAALRRGYPRCVCVCVCMCMCETGPGDE